jgi:hypothetical protein
LQTYLEYAVKLDKNMKMKNIKKKKKIKNLKLERKIKIKSK